MSVCTGIPCKRLLGWSDATLPWTSPCPLISPVAERQDCCSSAVSIFMFAGEHLALLRSFIKRLTWRRGRRSDLDLHSMKLGTQRIPSSSELLVVALVTNSATVAQNKSLRRPESGKGIRLLTILALLLSSLTWQHWQPSPQSRSKCGRNSRVEKYPQRSKPFSRIVTATKWSFGRFPAEGSLCRRYKKQKKTNIARSVSVIFTSNCTLFKSNWSLF